MGSDFRFAIVVRSRSGDDALVVVHHNGEAESFPLREVTNLILRWKRLETASPLRFQRKGRKGFAKYAKALVGFSIYRFAIVRGADVAKWELSVVG